MKREAIELAKIYLESCNDIQNCDAGNGEIQNDLVEMGLDISEDELNKMAEQVEAYCAENAVNYGKVFNNNQINTNLDNTLEIV